MPFDPDYLSAFQKAAMIFLKQVYAKIGTEILRALKLI